ncbi:PKD-like family lipoprotein [Pedobacter nyackensis]|uniref:PKD-like family lipoprotein n=1 Tax=Pedobacter nyackensis TaxID=475255 RepID=UPI00292FA5F6|nr:PKD-like family lipoprotein [Pedobacter nyackensis]
MQIKHITLTAAICCTLLFACKKDNNNFKYKELNELNIKGPEGVLTVVQRDMLRIAPVISESKSGSGPYIYKWEIYKPEDLASWEITPLNPANTSTTLSTKKDLEVEALQAPGNYIIQYTITDTKTNLRQSVRFPVTVNGKYYEGWMVMSEKAGKPLLSFVRKDETVFPDVIKSSNPDLVINGKPLAAFAGIQTSLQEVSVFTDQDMYRFSANDFAFKDKSADLFETPISPVSSPYYAVNSIDFDQYVVSNGSVYGSVTPAMGAARYSERFNGPADYSVFPYFMSGSYAWALFYDNNGKRFLQAGYNSRVFTTFASSTDPKVPFQMNDVGKTMVGGDKGGSNECFLVMKDNAAYYMYTILPDKSQMAGVTHEMIAAPDIALAKSFAASELNRHLYYAAGNKIYLYDILAESARVVYTFPANTRIKDLKMFKWQGWGPSTDPLYNKRMVVATYNGTEGELYYLDVLPIGDIANGTYTKKFGGFGDITQISYRHPNM